jgi:type VI secretion system secreted protein VgrG
LTAVNISTAITATVDDGSSKEAVMNGLQQEAAYGQERRLLRLRFPADDGPDSILLANRLGASEGLSRDFLYVVEALSDDAGIATTAVIGRMVTIELVRDDGSLRFFNGHVLAFSLLHTDGGLAFYRMELGPWLAFARLRHNNATFQHLNIGELSDRVLEHYPMRDHRRDIGGADPDVTYLCQHDESDHNFLHRRWEAQGWHYTYEHRADGHTLRLGDDTSAAPAITGESNAVRFQHQAGSKEEDGIHQWRPLRAVTPARATLASFDFKQARPARAEHVSGSGAGEASLLDSYENTDL